MRPRPLEVSLYRTLKARGACHYLLAVSGGVDSMALLSVFAELQPKIRFQYSVVHVHHGDTENSLSRDQAWSLVQKECQRLQVQFFSNKNNSEDIVTSHASSEAQLRQLRRDIFQQKMRESKADFLVLAQHSDDLLETRLIRLIRGVGTEGLVSMQEEKGRVLRPFLKFSREEVRNYLMERNGVWLEDPSNQQAHYLRNWIRNKWLPQLEQKRPGAISALARSFEILAQTAHEDSLPEDFLDNFKIIRSKFLQMSLSDKRRAVAIYFNRCGIEDFGLSHINELIKRLDVEQKELTFTLLKKTCKANARHIWLEDK